MSAPAFPDEIERVAAPVARIKRMAAAHFGLTAEELADGLDPYSARARQVAVWVADRATRFSRSDLGRLFNRDHSTISDACAAVDRDARLYANASALLDRVTL